LKEYRGWKRAAEMTGSAGDLTASQSWWGVLLFAIYTIPNVAGLVVMKYGLTAARASWRSGSYFTPSTLFVGVGAGLYIASFFIWLFILARYELSQAYPTAIGLTLVLSSLASALLLGEALPPVRMLGIAIIFAGIWLVTR
jgi:multidrug transporter EmrE-like cation transporter